MMEIDDINTKLPKRHVRLNLSLYGKSNSIHICRDIIRILGFPKYISLKIKGNKYIAILPCDVKEFMSFLVPLNLFSDKNGQFKITSKDFITSTFCKNNLDINKSYLIAGDYSEKENVVFFNMENHRIIINGKMVKVNEKQ